MQSVRNDGSFPEVQLLHKLFLALCFLASRNQHIPSDVLTMIVCIPFWICTVTAKVYRTRFGVLINGKHYLWCESPAGVAYVQRIFRRYKPYREIRGSPAGQTTWCTDALDLFRLPLAPAKTHVIPGTSVTWWRAERTFSVMLASLTDVGSG